PWGVARGGILDLAIIEDGEYSDDLASLVDFMPDNWSSWPTTYQEVTVLEDSPERGVIHVKRDWHEVVLETFFTLERGKSTMHIRTEMTNTGESSFEDILSGYVLWADGGFLYDRPGNQELQPGSADKALTDWTASYEENWTLAFHAPFANYTGYGGQDQYKMHTLNPKESISFEGWLQVIPKGELTPVAEFEAKRHNKQTGTLSGKVRTEAGKVIEEPVIMVFKDDTPYVWSTGANGFYEFNLPEGDYSISAMAENYSTSSTQNIKVQTNDPIELNFQDLKSPGEVVFDITDDLTGSKIDAKLEITEGQTYPVQYMGRKTFFTNLDLAKEVSFELAPGKYLFEIGSGEGFISDAIEKAITVSSGETTRENISYPFTFVPQQSNWYSADLHHHTDVLDGSTPTEDVLMSQLSAGLDFAFISDHDSGENHILMDSLTSQRDIPFIPSMEISPSWGHFNVFPLEIGSKLNIDPSSASISEIMEDARRMGAEVISVNHPYISYGYFNSLENGSATGGFNPQFDLVELNYGRIFEKDLELMYSFWNKGLAIYLTAGSDTHDIWDENTGGIRMYVHIPDSPTVGGFVRSIKNGHAYATSGPLIEPEYMFGSQVRITPGDELELPFKLMSVNNLKSVQLISGGEITDSLDIKKAGKETNISFSVRPEEESWYSIIVEDEEGEKAYSNPIWVVPAKYAN
ncbi:MAG: CehA/McbA family metallohydrolase, partial [Balneolales bacterium]